MYFEDRETAGQILANELVAKYRYEDCAVVALIDGGVVVGEQIAKALHCILTLLVVEKIDVPGEGISFGSVSQDGDFTYNAAFSVGEIEEYESEYHGNIEEQKMEERMDKLVTKERGNVYVVQHDDIVAALELRDADLAQQRMGAHIDTMLGDVKHQIEQIQALAKEDSVR